MSAEVTLFSSGVLISSAQVMSGETLDTGADMYVSGGGTANDITVNNGGIMRVYDGGTALEIVENGGYVDVADGADVTFKSNTISGLTFSAPATVHSRTAAERITLDEGGTIAVLAGGTAASVTVNPGGYMHIDSGGTAHEILENGGYVDVSPGAVVTFAVNTISSLTFSAPATIHSRTAAERITLDEGGAIAVMAGGTAASAVVNPGGYMHIDSGGTAHEILENGGYVDVSPGAVVTFAANVINGLIISGRHASLHSGTTACGVTLVDGGAMGAFAGGTAAGTIVDANGHLWIYDGGTAAETAVNSGGRLSVASGGSANSTIVNETGCLLVSAGGTATGIVENGGFVDVSDGAEVTFLSNTFSGLAIDGSATVHSGTTAVDTVIGDGGSLSVFEGGTVSGSLQIGEGAVVSAYSGAVIDFTVSAQADPATALINDWSLINGGNLADYTITVNAGQATGDYLLADGAAGFDRTVTVKTASGTELGTVTVGETLVTETAEYTLARSEGTLSLTVAAVVVPALATVAGNFGGVGGAFQLFDDGSAVVRAASGRTALEGTIDPDQWEIIGAGDFDNSGTDGLLWLEKATGYVYMQNDMTAFDEVNNRTNCLGVAVDGYALKAAGDFTGNGIDGALLQGPAFGDPEISLNYGLPVWARNDDGSAFNGWLGALVNTWQPGDPLAGDPADPADINARNYKYDVIGVGDFNGDGVDDVMLQNTMPTEVDDVVITGSGDVFTFLTGDKAAIEAGAPPTVCYAGCATGGWEVVGFGDFDGDGIDDALLSDGAGVAGWSMADGQRQGDLWFGNMTAGDEIAGIADFDGDGTDDILIRSTTTETLTARLVQNGEVTGTLAIA